MTNEEIINYVEYYNLKVAEILKVEPIKVILKFSKSLHTAGTCIAVEGIEVAGIEDYMATCVIIKISRALANIRSEHETQNTIIHELCHAYAPRKEHHGPIWKYIAQKVGDSLGFEITRTYTLSNAQKSQLNTKQTLKSPVALIEVPEIGYKQYIYRKCRGYYEEYKGWFLRINSRKYSLVFTKLR